MGYELVVSDDGRYLNIRAYGSLELMVEGQNMIKNMIRLCDENDFDKVFIDFKDVKKFPSITNRFNIAVEMVEYIRGRVKVAGLYHPELNNHFT